jgi:hypothetical protein
MGCNSVAGAWWRLVASGQPWPEHLSAGRAAEAARGGRGGMVSTGYVEDSTPLKIWHCAVNSASDAPATGAVVALLGHGGT